MQLVAENALHVDKLPMNARDMGVWASIILLASGSRRLGKTWGPLLYHLSVYQDLGSVFRISVIPELPCNLGGGGGGKLHNSPYS